MNIAVFGLGYVGLSNAVLLAMKHHVVAVEIQQCKVELINQGISPVKDELIGKFLADKDLDLHATTDAKECANADIVIVATPTDYDPSTEFFDTSSVESVLQTVASICPSATVVIRSTIPIGYIEKLHKKGLKNVVFMPEFLREGAALS